MLLALNRVLFEPVDVANGAVLVARDNQQLNPSVSEPDLNGIVFPSHCEQLLVASDCHAFDRLRLVVSKSNGLEVDSLRLGLFLSHNLDRFVGQLLFRRSLCSFIFWRA